MQPGRSSYWYEPPYMYRLWGQLGRESHQYLRNTHAFISFYHIIPQKCGFTPPIFLTSLRQCGPLLSWKKIVYFENHKENIFSHVQLTFILINKTTAQRRFRHSTDTVSKIHTEAPQTTMGGVYQGRVGAKPSPMDHRQWKNILISNCK